MPSSVELGSQTHSYCEDSMKLIYETLSNAWHMVSTRYMFVPIIINIWLSCAGGNMEADENYPMS